MPSPTTSPSASPSPAVPESPVALLGRVLSRYRDDAAVRELHHALSNGAARDDAPLALYEQSIRALENALPAHAYGENALNDYQSLCRGFEALTAAQGRDDERHRFMVIIPTADRPRQLRECLASLLELCRLFDYGSRSDGVYRRVSAMIADDSKDASSIEQHREMADEFTALGLNTTYFGLDDQLATLDRLPGALRERLGNIIGTPDRNAFHHKGHSVMRNILYLHLRARHGDDNRLLFYFADSDQEFKVKIGAHAGNGDGDREVYALNYFYHLDRLFTEHDIEMLTGKVVGDPPVSPAVMAGNFIDDVRAFLEQAGARAADAPCPFHERAPTEESGAAYHDMAALFGFKANAAAYAYRCTLRGAHTTADCVDDFTRKLSRFFDGEHPTRITYFDAADPLYRDGTPIRPARTVYTGNYVIRADALRRFVPFAPLRLRMSGPTFGRLLQAEIGARFVSANLPMLHKRTEAASGASEFRPGVVKRAQGIDLSNEFERQFFGDVMLFSIEKLAAMGFPQNSVTSDAIADILIETAEHMERLYADKHAQILAGIDALKTLRTVVGARLAAIPDAWARLDTFIDNMVYNFGPHAEGYRLIVNNEHRQRRHAQLLTIIETYRDDRVVWEGALGYLGSA